MDLSLSRSGFKKIKDDKKRQSQPHRDAVKATGASQPVLEDPV